MSSPPIQDRELSLWRVATAALLLLTTLGTVIRLFVPAMLALLTTGP